MARTPIEQQPGFVGRFRASDLALANGDPVSQWKSTDGLITTAQGTAAARPVFRTSVANGKPGVFFDGVDDALLESGTTKLRAATNNVGSLLVVAVVRNDATSGTAARWIQNIGRGSSAGGTRAASGLISTTAWRVAGRRLDGDTFQATDYGTQSIGPLIHTSRWVWSAAKTVFHLNGDPGASKAFQTAGNTSASNSQNAAIGALPAAQGEFWHGSVVELIFFTPDLTDAQRAEVHSELSDLYAITVADYVAATKDIIGGAGLLSASAFGVGQAVPQAVAVTGGSGLLSKSAFGVGRASLTVIGGVGLLSTPAFGVGQAVPQAATVSGGAGLVSNPAFGVGRASLTVSGGTGLVSKPAFGVGRTSLTVNGGAGLLSSPAFGVGQAIPQAATVAGGAGLLSNPAFGVGRASLTVTGGAGLVSDPAFGVGRASLTVRGGIGLVSDPAFGVGRASLTLSGGTGLVSNSAFGVGLAVPQAAIVKGGAGLVSTPNLGVGQAVPQAAKVSGGAGLVSSPALGVGLIVPDAVSLAGQTGLIAPHGFGSDGVVLPPVTPQLDGLVGLFSPPAFGVGEVIDVSGIRSVILSAVGPFTLPLNATGPAPTALSLTGPRELVTSTGPTKG